MGQGPLPSPGSVLKCIFNWDENGALFYSGRFFMSYSSGPAVQNDLNNLASAMVSQWSANWLNNFSTTIGLVTTEVQDLSSATGLLGVANAGASAQNASPPVESGTAVHLRFKTAYHYRGGHSGIYLPPGPQADVAQPASWTTAYQSAIVTMWNALITALKGVTTTSISGLNQVVVQYYKGSTPNTDPSPWAPKNVPKLQVPPQVHPVTNIICTPLIASQRKRRSATGA